MIYWKKLIYSIILIISSIKFWNYLLYARNSLFKIKQIGFKLINIKDINIKILTYNLFLLPNPFFYNLLDHSHSDYKNERCLLISKLINKYDIILFQEIHPGHNFRCNYIINEGYKLGLQYHYYHLGPSFISKYCLSNGLLILSRFPIISTDCVSFSNSKSYDNFIEKGCIYTKIKISPYIPDVHIFNSHLQSSYNKNIIWENIRHTQLKELNTFIKSKCDIINDIIFAGGDFNINHFDKEYNKLSKILEPLTDIYNLDKKASHTILLPYTKQNTEDSTICMLCKQCKLPKEYHLEKQKLDYIFYQKNNNHIKLISKNILPNYVKNTKYKFNRLSDHFAIKAEFNLNYK